MALETIPSGPLSAEEKAELRACEEAIRDAWLGQGEALSRLRYGLAAHRAETTTKGRPIPTEAGRWKAYIRRTCPDLTLKEAEACMAAYHQQLARLHHQTGAGQSGPVPVVVTP
mgnify:CR=1 FL=1